MPIPRRGGECIAVLQQLFRHSDRTAEFLTCHSDSIAKIISVLLMNLNQDGLSRWAPAIHNVINCTNCNREAVFKFKQLQPSCRHHRRRSYLLTSLVYAMLTDAQGFKTSYHQQHATTRLCQSYVIKCEAAQ
eukprot:scaffold69131_cov36-Cyclotella_meneghiniana.AAC.2